MSKRTFLVQCVLFTVAILLTACATASAATPITASVTATTVPVHPTIAPTAADITTDAVQSDNSAIKVGLVTNIDGVNDHGYNQLAWEGIQRASGEWGFESRFIESQQPTDYEANIDQLATEGYNVIITVGSLMGDVTALKARQYPDIKFAIIDHAYVPNSGSQYCNETVVNCYTDGGLTNVTSLTFAEHQSGFLAGVLAGGMSRTGFVCSVTSIAPPASDPYVMSFRAGAVWQGGEEIRGMNNYINIQTTNSNIPAFTDATDGHETALRLIGEGCDVVFGIVADGALLAAHESNVMAIGSDVDQYNTYPEAQNALISSALKNVDVAVYNYLRTVVDGSVRAGVSTGNLQNGGVGLAPFHDWDSRIPDDLRADIQMASEGIINGSITIDLP